MNKNLMLPAIIFLIITPIFGLNLIISLIGNILILFLLVPLLVFIVALFKLNSLKSKIQQCQECGSTIIGNNKNCIYCGANLNNNENQYINNASEETIEVEAEEIK